jgi:hypothetical protein
MYLPIYPFEIVYSVSVYSQKKKNVEGNIANFILFLATYLWICMLSNITNLQYFDMLLLNVMNSSDDSIYVANGFEYGALFNFSRRSPYLFLEFQMAIDVT